MSSSDGSERLLPCAPVVFPWYLLWLLPLLTSASTLLIIVWTLGIIPTYVMWPLRTLGRPWGSLPGWVMLLEYGCLATACAIIALRRLMRPAASRYSNGLVSQAHWADTRTLYPKIRRAHPTQHPFNSPRRDVHENFNPTRCDPSFSLQQPRSPQSLRPTSQIAGRRIPVGPRLAARQRNHRGVVPPNAAALRRRV
jgi:hypothetical protein